MSRTIPPLLLAAFLAGCNALGQSGPPPCPKTEGDGATCMSARQVYDATHNADHVDSRIAPPNPPGKRTSKSNYRSDYDSDLGSSTDANGQSDDPVRSAFRTPVPAVDRPIPVRNPAVVMRIYIGPWQDDSKDLNAGQIVFTEIQGPTWTLGAQQISMVQQQVTQPLLSGKKVSASSSPVSSSKTVSPLDSLPGQKAK